MSGRRVRAVLLALRRTVLASAFGPAGALAAGPPVVVSTSVEAVSSTAADPAGVDHPEGPSTSFRFEYITEAAFKANLEANPPNDPFLGASITPPGGSGNVGVGTNPVVVSQRPAGLLPATAYRFRVRATNSAGTVFGPIRPFGTQEPTNAFVLPDDRGWEMVSPIDKNGGAVQGPGQIGGGGVFQAAAGGSSITYSSTDSFGAGAQGAPTGSQYLATRGTGGWSSSNITTPLLSGSYGDEPDGVPYQLFSSDLSAALLSNGERCRGLTGEECPVANPPLSGTDAPPGYRDYYRRDGSGGFESLIAAADLAETNLGPDQFELRFVAASSDLAHVVVSSCAALTANATEVDASGGCDEAAQNLYEWSASGLTLLNVLPGDTEGTPGAAVAAPVAVSADGSSVYWAEGGNLYLSNGGQSKQVDDGVGGGGVFQTASDDGSVALFTKAGHLYSYSAATDTATDLTPGGEVKGVLGASADASSVYYLTATGLFLSDETGTTEVAAAADPGDYPPSTGTARVTPDGSHLIFVSSAELTGYPNEGATEVFLYGSVAPGGAPALTCISCDPAGELPEGPSSIPGAVANGKSVAATASYKPRVLSSDGSKAFFDTGDGLVPQDTNKQPDVYEWEAQGSGHCLRVGGCVGLISSGRSPEPATLLDASADGSDAYFLTSASLFPLDPGSYDVYDARVGGGFSVPSNQIPCNGDACQSLPEAPEDPTPGTLVPNAGNPPLKTKVKKHRKHHHKNHGKKNGNRGGKR